MVKVTGPPIHADPLAVLARAVDAAALGQETADVVLVRIPEFGDVDDDFRLAVLRSCVDNVAAILDGLASGTDPAGVAPPAGAVALVTELVRRGVGLGALLRAYRLGHQLVDERFETAAGALAVGDPDRRFILAAASQFTFAYVDEVCTALVTLYESERDTWLRGAAATRAELVQRVLDGEDVDERAAERTLLHPTGDPQLALLAWVVDPTTSVEPVDLKAAVRDAALALGGRRTLVVPCGPHLVWAWTTAPALDDPDCSTRVVVDPALAVAHGTVHRGVAGMRKSHLEARAARRVSEVVGRAGGRVQSYRQLALSAVVTADLPGAMTFAHDELGALAEDDDATRRLRATLAVYLDELASLTATGRRLGIHPNTVRYRIGRCERILGYRVTERRLELEVALRLLNLAARTR